MGASVAKILISFESVQENLRNPGDGILGWFVQVLFKKNNNGKIFLGLDEMKATRLGGVNADEGYSVLEIGYGGGFAIEHILNTWGPALRVVQGVDISKTMLEEATKYLQNHERFSIVNLQLGGAEHMPHIQSESMNVVFHANVAHFWPDLSLALTEIHRVMKPGGQMMTLLPYKAYEAIEFKKEIFPNQDKQVYLQALKNAGFDEFAEKEIALEGTVSSITCIFCTRL